MEGVAAARRARRRRGALAAVAVAAVALVLAVLAVAVDPGAEHGKKLSGRSGEIHVP
jgi:ferric-dicitrate binding protein FerR (iron transport regulator)